MQTKSATDINDKYSTGLYQDTTKLVYHLPLDAGTYTLTGGFTEWWGLSRAMYQTVSVDGTELAKGSVPLAGSNTPLSADLTFTLAAPATVDYVVTNEGAGSEKPVISWLAVADVTLPGAPANAKAVAVGRHRDQDLVGCLDPVGARILGLPRLRGRRHGAGVRGHRDAVHRHRPHPGHDARVRGRRGEPARRRRAVCGDSIHHPARRSRPTTVPPQAPGKGVLSSNDGWDTGLKDGTFQVTMDMWWGVNGSLFKLYQDGVLVGTGAAHRWRRCPRAAARPWSTSRA